MTDWPDFTLYKREKWKFDSPQLEHAEFIKHYDRVGAVQHIFKKKLACVRPGGYSMQKVTDVCLARRVCSPNAREKPGTEYLGTTLRISIRS